MSTAVAIPQGKGLGALIGRSVRLMWWVFTMPAALIVILASGSLTGLVYIHALSGVLWTGADIFMAVLFGPVLNRLEPPLRKRVTGYFLPRSLVYMFLMSVTCTTAGYYLAQRLGVTSGLSPLHGVFVAAAVFGIALFIQGVGFILPTNLRVYLEVEKEDPDLGKVQRLLRRFIYFVSMQAILQVAIMFVMALFLI